MRSELREDRNHPRALDHFAGFRVVEVSLGEIEVPAEAVGGDGDGAEFLGTNRGVMWARDVEQMALDLPRRSFHFRGDELRKSLVAG